MEDLLGEMKQPSPIGTFAITEHNYQRIQPRLRLYVVLRILRYVSPHPWGSLRSTNMRRMRSLEHILSKLNSDPYVTQNFVAGSGVKWSSVIFDRDGVKALPKMSKRESGQLVGWIASRQPPTQKQLDSSNRTLYIMMSQPRCGKPLALGIPRGLSCMTVALPSVLISPPCHPL